MASGNEVEGVEKIADLATVEFSFEENNTNIVIDFLITISYHHLSSTKTKSVL